MPFLTRKLEPRFVCRGHVPGSARDWPVGAELEAVANGALTASLKQLASLLVVAEDIFAELTAELAGIANRSGKLRTRLDRIEERLAAQDPKKIPVPESDICTFASRTEHFRLSNEPERCLFTLDTRPKALRQLYEAAAAVAVRSLDSLRRDRDATSSIDMFICAPILGKRRRDQSLDIESRVPRAIEDLRRWTSAEALGDVTVTPDCNSRILADSVDDSQPVDHKLPSPEEQVQAIALKFPAEIVAVDVSGRGFQRMSMRRRSMHTGLETQEPVKRRSRPRRPRGKRRNTIAGTDQKEIRQAVGGETMTDEPEEAHTGSSTSKRAHRSASTDLLGSGSKKYLPVEKKSHFNTLKAWGMSRLKLISPKSSQQQQNHVHADVNESTTSLTSPSERSSRQHQSLGEDEIRSADDSLTTTTTTSSRRARREAIKSTHERKPSSSSSSGKSVSSLGVSIKQQANGPVSVDVDDKEPADKELKQQTASSSRQSSVKLRESAAERRERRKASSRPDEPPHSSSGNWSASSESGRASIGSETTTTTHPPRSTTTASIGTSSTSLSHVRRLKGRDNSASSSVTSEGTLTPDIIQDISAVPFSDDGETSSVYSCDTEGYYTSFHVDSGLKTLREEEPLTPQSPQTKTNEVQSDPTSPIVENEYELFGRGSTSTTTSSAGTVCTTLLAPPPPERKSSLTVVAMVHGQKQNGGESPDSGHNTSSSPVESASSPACTGRSCSEFEYSESSDLEGCERIERIRSKTAINTSRIPSMCVITPPNSDDEHHKDAEPKEAKQKKGRSAGGSVLMSATVGTSKMEVINGQDKNLYATVQTVMGPSSNNAEKANTVQNAKVSPLSGVLGRLRGVLPGRKHQQKPISSQEASQQPQQQQQQQQQLDSGDYVTIADVRNNNDKRRQDSAITTTPTNVRSGSVTYANADLFKRDAEYVSLSELPKKPDSSLERRRQGARVILDSEGKVVYSSDSLRRRKGAHTTFIPGPFVKEGPSSPAPSPLLHRAQITPRAVQRTNMDAVDGEVKASTEPDATSLPQQPGKVIIRAAKSPDRTASPDYVRTPATVVGPTAGAQRQTRHGAYVNVQGNGSEGKTATGLKRTAGSARSIPKFKANAGSNSRLNGIREEVRNVDSRGSDNTENKPPESKTRARHSMTLRFRHKPHNSLERKILKPSSRQLNNELEKPWSYPQSLVPNGNTPKLVRRLPVFETEPLKTESNSDSATCQNKENSDFVANGLSKHGPESKGTEASVNLSESLPDKVTETPRVERKLKRSESYRMANSPIMFIKKLGVSSSTFSDKSSEKKMFRTASEELREELLKERINYPESVASPEPEVDLNDSLSNLDESVTSLANSSSNSNAASKMPHSPRPRATDLEPARVLKYSEKVLLAIQPSESVSTSACPQQQTHHPQQQDQHQPPPYIGPPQVQKIHEDYPYQVVYDDQTQQHHLPNNLQSQLRQNLPISKQQHPIYYHQSYHHPQQTKIHHIVDPYQQLIYEKNNLHHQHRQQAFSNYAEDQAIYAQQLRHPMQAYEKSQQQQFYTLPNRRPQREVIVEPPRSITPDITRGLARGPLSAMHMMARQGQKSNSAEKLVAHHHNQAGHNCQMDLNRKNLEQFEVKCKLAAQQQQRQAPVDVKNRFASPLSLSALGYRFFASTVQGGLKDAPISPIGPEHANGFKSSTPTGRVTPSVAERLAFQSQRCSSPNPALMQHASSEKQLLTSSDSGRGTPANLILSPIKSTMSNEELFAAIHKSKRRLNIRDDPESLSPAGSVTSLNKNQQVIGTRHSWSPESQKVPEIPKTVLSPSATSRMDFKRLLLQQSIKTGPTRISAAEQLKLSRQQCQESQHQQQQTNSPVKLSQQVPLTKVLSPRSVWRFQTPRTDVLSSTIIEDAAAEEKAMKPSPENPSPVSRLPTTTRRQLNLSGENNNSKDLEELKNVINDNSQRTLDKKDKELENRLQANDADESRKRLAGEKANNSDLDNPIKAIESRRMSNQLARAQFLANSTPKSNAPASHKDFFNKRFRARSESPQQNAQRTSTTPVPANAVTRSPSAPALETAL